MTRVRVCTCVHFSGKVIRAKLYSRIFILHGFRAHRNKDTESTHIERMEDLAKANAIVVCEPV